MPKRYVYAILGLWVACQEAPQPQEDGGDWPMYFGQPSVAKFSPLDQINRENVDQLKLAWKWTANDAGASTTIQCNPLKINDRLYVISPGLKVVALHPVSGEEIWSYSPSDRPARGGNSRGVTYWTDGVVERLFYGAGRELHAIDAKTGTLATDFAQAGKLDLSTGLGTDATTGWAGLTTPGVVFEDFLILGSRVGEGPAPSAPGHIRAFDVRTGELQWLFRTIPQVTDPEATTWSPEHLANMGGANAWGGFSLDEERGMVFCGTGSASYDHWGGDRMGENLYANCVLALDARTGQKVWHQQLVHHDIWDYDIPCPPNLVQVRVDGRLVDAVAQPTKMGHLFVFRRDDGTPLFPIEEISVPASQIPGEVSWPTQPFPKESLRYGAQGLQAGQLNTLTAELASQAEESLSGIGYAHLYDPPGVDPAAILPQFNGGTDWGGAAYAADTRTLFVNCSNVAEWISMIPNKPQGEMTRYEMGAFVFRSQCRICHNPAESSAPQIDTLAALIHGNAASFRSTLSQGKGLMPAFAHLNDEEVTSLEAFLTDQGKNEILTEDQWSGTAQAVPWIATGHNEVWTEEGYPVNQPPWGTLTAIDLDQGEIRWQTTLGTYPALEAAGHPPTGTFNMGGPIATAGGLVFIGATMDERFRAFDQEDGEVLWEYQLDAGAYSTPATFSVDGVQYIVVGAGGGGKPGTKSGANYYCFSL